MKIKLIFYPKPLILIIVFTCFIWGQSTGDRESEQNKNFGYSLKQNPDDSDSKNNVRKEKNAGTDDDVIRVETKLVVTDILVLDKKGRAINGLKKEDFIVSEDDKSQKVESFSLGDDSTIPRSIVLIIDYSGSQLPYIKTSIEAAKILVDKLKPKDKMALVTDDVELLANFTQDKELLKEKLESLKTKALSGKTGRSDQFSALYAVLNEIFNDEDVRPIIIFQTDGDELVSLKDGPFSAYKNQKMPLSQNIPIPGRTEKNFSFIDVLKATEKKQATVYTIFPGIRLTGFSENEQLIRAKKDFENRANIRVQMGGDPALAPPPEIFERFIKSLVDKGIKTQTILAGLAKFTGGLQDFLEISEQANDVYTRILSNINDRYVIGYYPTNEAKDGVRRVIKIEVRNHPEYTIWGRKSYIAPKAED